MENKEIRRHHLLKAIESHGRKIANLARATNTNPSVISQIKNRTRFMGDDFRKQMEKALGLPNGAWDIPPGVITDVDANKEVGAGTPPKTTNVTHLSNLQAGPDIKGWIPVIDAVSAGQWEDPSQINEPFESIENPVAFHKPHSVHTFALRVEGSSMTNPAGNGPSYPHGMIIIVNPELRGSVVPGDRIIAKVKGSTEVTFKQLWKEDGIMCLKPLNPSSDYKIIYDHFKVLGKVIGGIVE